MQEISIFIYLIVGYILMSGYRALTYDKSIPDTTEYMVVNILITGFWPIFIAFHILLFVFYLGFVTIPKLVETTIYKRK